MTCATTPAMLGCVSHAPIILIRTRAPAAEPQVNALRDAFRAQVQAFAPQQVVFFGNNHFAGFHYANMPAFCVGAQAEAVPDLGGCAGPLDVPREDAIALVEHLREEGFDPAISYRMKVDHAVSQPLERLVGGLRACPVLPIFVSVFTPPFMRLRRSRQFGAAVGRFIARSGKRTLVMGTGGLSHHPAHYFPLLGTAAPDVHGYQLDGAQGGTMSDEQWFARFERMHLDGAASLGSGKRTAKDVRLNPALDQQILRHLCEGSLAAMDDWDQQQLVEQAGVGILEIHTWIAATAAFRAVDAATPIRSFYAEAVEYGGGYGMLYSGDLQAADAQPA